jgi:hypothetical protein
MKKVSLYTLLSAFLCSFLLFSAAAQNQAPAFKKNRISLGVMDMAFGEVGVKYERLLGNGQLGLCLPLNVSYYDAGMYDYDSDFFTGLGLNFYPTGQGVWRYFCGLEFNIGYGTFYYSESGYEPFWGYYWYDRQKDGTYTRFHINNGIMYSPTKEFCVDFSLGLGFRNAFIKELPKDDKINPNASLGINLSYRF